MENIIDVIGLNYYMIELDTPGTYIIEVSKDGKEWTHHSQLSVPQYSFTEVCCHDIKYIRVTFYFKEFHL
tara:strand:+ start:1071 stop:1280 length:210 start_codon:yes stop_codon:yes gene_type:complete